MFWTATRFIDCARLKLEDINIKEGYFIIRKQKNKTYDEKYPLCEEAKTVLKAWVSRRPEAKDSHVFLNNRGRPFAAITWCMAIRAARRKSGIDGGVYLRTVSGRAYCRLTGHSHKVVRLQMAEGQGLDLRELQALGHHKDHRSTLRYLSNPVENYSLKLRALRKLSESSGKPF